MNARDMRLTRPYVRIFPCVIQCTVKTRVKRSRDKATSSLLSVSEFASDGFYDLPFLSSGPLPACRENEKVVILFERPVLYTPVRHRTNGRKRNFNFPRSVTAHPVFTKIKKPARCIMYFAMWRTITFASGLFDFAKTRPIGFR